MTVFAYNPIGVKDWASRVMKCISGDTPSIASCSKKFTEQLEKLVQPNVWTGGAAHQNFENFLKMHDALVRFSNSFGSAFDETIKKVNQAVSDLELANLAASTNVTNALSGIDFTAITSLATTNIAQTETVTYDYNVIMSIAGDLKSIMSDLESVNSTLKGELSKLGNGNESIWAGQAADSARETLLNTLTTNMNVCFETLTLCINKINEAGEAAKNADLASR